MSTLFQILIDTINSYGGDIDEQDTSAVSEQLNKLFEQHRLLSRWEPRLKLDASDNQTLTDEHYRSLVTSVMKIGVLPFVNMLATMNGQAKKHGLPLLMPIEIQDEFKLKLVYGMFAHCETQYESD